MTTVAHFGISWDIAVKSAKNQILGVPPAAINFLMWKRRFGALFGQFVAGGLVGSLLQASNRPNSTNFFFDKFEIEFANSHTRVCMLGIKTGHSDTYAMLEAHDLKSVIARLILTG